MDELVKRLHRYTENFVAYKLDADFADAVQQAADAIEQLSADLERLKDYEAFWKEEAEEALRRYQLVLANKPRWISVEERLPYKSGYYLIVTHLGLTDDAEAKP